MISTSQGKNVSIHDFYLSRKEHQYSWFLPFKEITSEFVISTAQGKNILHLVYIDLFLFDCETSIFAYINNAWICFWNQPVLSIKDTVSAHGKNRVFS